MKHQTFVEMRAEEVQDVLTRPPAWLIRWGATFIFIILGLVFFGAWMIHYPDLVRASFRLTSANAPRAILAHTNGKVVRLFVQDGSTVYLKAPLVFLESTARHTEVIRLSKELDKAWEITRKGKLERLSRLNLSSYHQLGELQNAYQIFERIHIKLSAYLANGFYSQKKAMLKQEIVDLQALSNNLLEQQNIQAIDIQLAQDDYDVQRRLYEEKVISRLDLKREESKNISRSLPYKQTASAIISNLTQQRAKQKEILELDRQVDEERDTFLQSLNTLKSEVDAWEAKYIISAPIGGRISFTGTLQENQSVAINQEMFYISPPTTDYFGEMGIPQQSLGKVQVGQEVIIKLAAFPYQEFGSVKGRIVKIADIPLKDSVFLAKVVLPEGLKTTYNKSLSFRTGMVASAEIITTDSRLLEKLFYQLRKAINSQ